MTTTPRTSQAAGNGGRSKPLFGRFLATLQRYLTVKMLLGAILSLAVGYVLVYVSFPRADSSVPFYVLREIGKAVFITALVTAAVRWYLVRQFSELEQEKSAFFQRQVSTAISGLQNEVLRQTHDITQSMSSLAALQGAGAVRFYSSRSDASKDIAAALLDSSASEINIIGISLNDFTREYSRPLRNAWRRLESAVRTQRPLHGRSLTIRVLLIDPSSEGAYLRGEAESVEDSPARLRQDVDISLNDFLNLQAESSGPSASESAPSVVFEARVYRTAPILYLVWTPAVSFVQQYYFRPRHLADVSIPVVEYHRHTLAEGGVASLHDELRFHFRWVWDNASVPIEVYARQSSHGYELACRNASIENVFYDQALSRSRILHLMESTREILWIKGISLRSYFEESGDLYEVISRKATEGVDVRVLLINPEGEQARIRSFKELLMKRPDATLEEFEEQRVDQKLYRDTRESIACIRRLRSEPGVRDGNFAVRLFDSAPEAFFLVTDEAILVEQYHYGKIRAHEERKAGSRILGGDMPVIEYRREHRERPGHAAAPYDTLKNHFEYVFDHWSRGLDSDTRPQDTDSGT